MMIGSSSCCCSRSSTIAITEFTKFAASSLAVKSLGGIEAANFGNKTTTTDDGDEKDQHDDGLALSLLADHLSQLAIRSKGYYYHSPCDRNFMRQVKDELTYTIKDCMSNPTYVASSPKPTTTTTTTTAAAAATSTTSTVNMPKMKMDDIVGFYQLSSSSSSPITEKRQRWIPKTKLMKAKVDDDGDDDDDDDDDNFDDRYDAALVDNIVELEALFVEPNCIGSGLRIGSKLFQHAIDYSRDTLSAQTMIVQSDPYAEEFYIKQGCVHVGTKESGSIPGRYLPLLHYQI